MGITYNEQNRTFMLRAADSLYAIAIVDEGYLCHAYYGKNVADEDLTYLLRLDENPFVPSKNNRDRACFLDATYLEYPSFGIGDYRECAFRIIDENGFSATDLRYDSHRIFSGKPKLEGLPATFADENQAQTLEITLKDKRTSLYVTLRYSTFENLPVIARSVSVENKGCVNIHLNSIMSACVDFDEDDYDMITLYGSWARERTASRVPLHHGKQLVDSARGESSHQYNPFFVLCSKNADEETGDAYGFSLVYSGNFKALCEVSQHNSTRAMLGINPLDFEWLLEPNARFDAPEAILVYSDCGLGKMSRTYHDLYREHLIRSKYKYSPRPILINNWEATYFNFDDKKLLDIAKQSAELGIEMLVMDDGWFGHRDSDNSSLGDWFVYESKIKCGLKNLVDEVNALGMKFGIWFEPEMVSPDSELFREHPDWAIQVPDMDMTLCREQYVLDFSRKDVRDCIYGRLKDILKSANIEYVKWDMNRQLTEVGSAMLKANCQRELWHRYVLGVYDMMERLVTDFPDLLLENCSGGGARFDPGMLYYSPQIWCSDDTDAIERLRIQYGTSLCYPPSAMGAHVSVCPNHTSGRWAPFKTRGIVAMAGTFGYELDITKLSDEDKQCVKEQIADYKKYNKLMICGDQYRLGNVNSDRSFDAWIFVSKDKSQAILSVVQIDSRISTHSRRIKISGLDENAFYKNNEDGSVLSGKALKYCGINIKGLYGDFAAKTIYFTKCDN
ncbi:MAG: alpha-galactosidase [Oscillospiraceae bacterium]|nr:alpha-galactosidase [Oscillospiraceae bacterium]